MTKDKALKMAIEALDTLMMEKGSIYQQALQACKDALEQTAQEPVAYMYKDQPQSVLILYPPQQIPKSAIPLYTHPAPAWQGLSDRELFNLSQQCDLNNILGLIDYGRAIEQALKEKNND